MRKLVYSQRQRRRGAAAVTMLRVRWVQGGVQGAGREGGQEGGGQDLYKEVVEKGLREVDNEVDKKINFLGRKHGRGDDAWSKAGAVTSGDYSRPQLKHYHKCAPGLGRCGRMAPDRPHHQEQLLFLF